MGLSGADAELAVVNPLLARIFFRDLLPAVPLIFPGRDHSDDSKGATSRFVTFGIGPRFR